MNVSGIGITLHVNKDGRGYQVRCQLTLFVYNVVRGIAQQWPVVGVEEHLLWALLNDYLVITKKLEQRQKLCFNRKEQDLKIDV